MGKLRFHRGFETSEPGVYAIGDVCADIQLAHVAAAQGTYVVVKNCRPSSYYTASVSTQRYVCFPSHCA